MNLWILCNPNKDIPYGKRFIKRESIEECLKITPKQLSYLLYRVKRIATEHNIRTYLTPWLYPWSGYHSYTSADRTQITHMLLAPQKKILPTYKHEMLHYLYGFAMEGEVLAMEHQMAMMMSSRQWNILHNCLDICLNRAPKMSPRQLLELLDPRDAAHLMRRQRREVKAGRMVKEWVKSINRVS